MAKGKSKEKVPSEDISEQPDNSGLIFSHKTIMKLLKQRNVAEKISN